MPTLSGCAPLGLRGAGGRGRPRAGAGHRRPGPRVGAVPPDLPESREGPAVHLVRPGRSRGCGGPGFRLSSGHIWVAFGSDRLARPVCPGDRVGPLLGGDVISGPRPAAQFSAGLGWGLFWCSLCSQRLGSRDPPLGEAPPGATALQRAFPPAQRAGATSLGSGQGLCVQPERSHLTLSSRQGPRRPLTVPLETVLRVLRTNTAALCWALVRACPWAPATPQPPSPYPPARLAAVSPPPSLGAPSGTGGRENDGRTPRCLSVLRRRSCGGLACSAHPWGPAPATAAWPGPACSRGGAGDTPCRGGSLSASF